jgi:hypothetical protein
LSSPLFFLFDVPLEQRADRNARGALLTERWLLVANLFATRPDQEPGTTGITFERSIAVIATIAAGLRRFRLFESYERHRRRRC